MLKNLLSEHFVLSAAALIVVSAAWLLGRMDTVTALPIVVMLAGVNVGASVYQRGLNTGVPLQSPPAAGGQQG